MSYVPVAFHNVSEWMRQVATVLNPVANGYPFPRFDTAPPDIEAGFTYFDTALAKVRTWDGSAWQNHW